MYELKNMYIKKESLKTQGVECACITRRNAEDFYRTSRNCLPVSS